MQESTQSDVQQRQEAVAELFPIAIKCDVGVPGQAGGDDKYYGENILYLVSRESRGALINDNDVLIYRHVERTGRIRDVKVTVKDRKIVNSGDYETSCSKGSAVDGHIAFQGAKTIGLLK